MTIYNLSNDLERSNAQKYLDRLIKQGCITEVRKPPVKRTNPQNRYFHSLLKLFVIESGEQYNQEEIKIIAKRTCDFMIYEKGGNKFIKSSADLDTKEFTLLIECFRNWSSKEAGIYLPSPEEFQENESQISGFIKNNSMYLK